MCTALLEWIEKNKGSWQTLATLLEELSPAA
jgi:hypothetical protein